MLTQAATATRRREVSQTRRRRRSERLHSRPKPDSAATVAGVWVGCGPRLELHRAPTLGLSALTPPPPPSTSERRVARLQALAPVSLAPIAIAAATASERDLGLTPRHLGADFTHSRTRRSSAAMAIVVGHTATFTLLQSRQGRRPRWCQRLRSSQHPSWPAAHANARWSPQRARHPSRGCAKSSCRK